MTVRESEKKVYSSLDEFKSFCFDAGPGSGKTYTLEKAIEHIISKNSNLSVQNQKILCITYTNAAKDEIIERLGKNSEVLISTIHDFLWNFISPQTILLRNEHKNKIIDEIKNTRKKLAQNSVYLQIAKLDEFKSLVCSSEFKTLFYKICFQKAAEFRENLRNFQNRALLLPYLSSVQKFKTCVNLIIKEDRLCKTLKEINEGKSKPIIYDPTKNRDQLSRYRISHNTLLEYSKNIIENNNVLKRMFSDRYPYVLIDEYQDTNKKVVDLLNSILKYPGRKHNFVIGFFGDSKQNIYDQGIGTLPEELELSTIQEQENRRSCKSIVKVINKIRNDDLNQISDKENGTCQFYVTNNEDNISDNFNLNGSHAYLFLKNSTIAEINGYKDLREILGCFPHFSNANYDNLNNEFFQKNLQNIGWFLRDILNLINFKKEIDNPNTTIKELESYITTGFNITFGDFKSFLLQVKEIEKTDITLDKYINSLFKINGVIKGRKIIYNIFSCEKDINEIKVQACEYFYDNGQEIEDDDVSGQIDGFFNIKLSQFENWYDYVYRKNEGKSIGYYTLHGSKGLEFDDVVVVLQDDFARRTDFFKFFFKNYDKGKEIEREDENNKERMYYVQARNLLYVACSRAKENLYVVYKTNNISDIQKNIENIFGDIHYLNIKKI